MTREEAIEYLKRADTTVGQTIKTRTAEAIELAIEALEFMEKYDAVWESIKCAGENGREIELHRYGRVYRIREVAT